MHESRRTDESQKHTKHIEISPASEILGKLNKTKTRSQIWVAMDTINF